MEFKISQWEFVDSEFDKNLLSLEQPRVDGWVSMDGIPVQGGVHAYTPIGEVLSNGTSPVLSTLRLRDPDKFVAGGLHHDLSLWEVVLANHPKRDMIYSWLSDGVNVLDFREPFSGSFKGVRYDSDGPPAKVWPNHASCKKHAQFVTEAILKRVKQGGK